MKTFAATLVWVALVAILTAVFATSEVRGVAGPVANASDFRAFYCGGRALVHGADPYRTEPLRSCEQQSARDAGLRMYPSLVVPAPLPPYALLAFAPLGMLPFSLASPIWLALCTAAFAATILLLLRMQAAPAWLAAAALFGPDAYMSLTLGQLVPVVVCALVACAWALRAGKFALAGIFAAATLLEPHAGLAVCVALFACAPRTRRTLGIACAALAAISLLCGPALCWEYARFVLPLHARSEIDQLRVQYSLTSAAYALGAGRGAALAAGAACYAAMLALGAWLGGRLARTYAEPAFVPLTAAAAIVIGGSFIHLQQMALALPFGLLLLTRAPARWRLALAFGVACVAVPWEKLLLDAPALEMTLFGKPPALVARSISPAAPDSYAEIAEMAFSSGGGYVPDPRTAQQMLITKLPTWLGLLVLVGVGGFQVLPRRALETRA